MKDFYWSSSHKMSGRRASSADSRRERDYSRRQARARKHLERIRGGTQAPIPFSLLVPAAIVASLSIGMLFGSPLVATARSWIGGEPVHIEAIFVRGSQLLSAAEIATATGVPPGAPWTAADPRAIEARLLEHPWIAEARAVRLPTGRVLVHIREEIPRALVAIGKPAQDFVVNQHGVPFAPAGDRVPTGLPRLIPNAAVERDVADAELASAIELAYRLPAFDLPMPSELFVSKEDDPTGFALQLPGLKPRVVLGRSHFDERLAGLARLLKSGLAELESTETLDLRFADQAVLRGTTPPKEAKQAAAARGRAASSGAGPTG